MDENWMRFENTGSVNDYLNYRNRVEEEALQAINSREEENNRERLHPVDGNGATVRTYW